MDQEIEYQQQQLHDIIAQQTSKMTEGLEEEYDQLDELEVASVTKDFKVEKEGVSKETVKVGKQQSKPEANYDKLLADLLN